ncbi:UNVERIFIED_CONTAM: Piezo-type mechanosensitive ion channel [Sesamum radiatum]|uniref:Piezo-type mechanosensitive ion channel n=2 Tax=Sesamum radiatum TaxID=300843 RepID=A0AAW2W343_SESRA
MSLREGNLTEQLLPSRSSFFVHQLRSGVRHTNILLRGQFSGFLVSTGLHMASRYPCSLFRIGASTLQVFVHLDYLYMSAIFVCFSIFVPFASVERLASCLHSLVAVSTYVFNVAFAYTKLKAGKDMEIWEMVGLWHYPIPGFFLLAQFCLGILVALGNLVNNSVFLCLSNEERRLSTENETEEVKEDAKVLVVATIAWGLRKCSRAIMLLLIFLIATKPGFIHAAYMIYFFAYLLSHKVNKRMRQSLILLCEAHFAILYILQLNLVSRKLEQKGSTSLDVLSQLGLLESDSSLDFLEIAILACFCAIYNHGFEMLFSFSAIVQHTACPPIGFSILRAGLSKSVLLSVYATSNIRDSSASCSHERRIALYLNAIGKKVLSTYRSFGTYIAFLTILIAVYLVRPNFISFGYTFLLLVWIIGRQLVEKTKRRLWFPLKVYAIAVFVFIYILSIFPTFKTWMSSKLDLLVSFGYNMEASLSENLSESLAIMIMWGKQAKMFPGQKHHEWSLFLGLQVYRPSFEGLEAGLRSKVLDNPSLSGSRELSSQMMEQSSWSFSGLIFINNLRFVLPQRWCGSNRKYDYIWGTVTESYKWKKKRIVALRQERFEMQKTTLRVYLKFWMENMFNLFGLEINMIALLLASFALLNAISMVYIACLATCILLPRPIIRKLWPIFAFLFATVLLAEYIAMWKSMMPLNRQVAMRAMHAAMIAGKTQIYISTTVRKCWLAEQIGAIVREQEKKAAWKTEQLQHIRKSEENKTQRNLQVEKMKSEMLNLQIQLHGMNSSTACGNESPTSGSVRRRRNASLTMQDFGNFEKRDGSINPDQGFSLNMNEYPSSVRGESPFAVEFTKHLTEASFGEITELEEYAG